MARWESFAPQTRRAPTLYPSPQGGGRWLHKSSDFCAQALWLILIASRAWMADKWTADIEGLFYDCIGIIIAFFIVPWRYVWARYVKQPMEPLRQG